MWSHMCDMTHSKTGHVIGVDNTWMSAQIGMVYMHQECMYVCLCICMYACMYDCTYICMQIGCTQHEWICASMYVCMYVYRSHAYMSVREYVCMYICMYIHMYVYSMHACMHACMYIPVAWRSACVLIVADPPWAVMCDTIKSWVKYGSCV